MTATLECKISQHYWMQHVGSVLSAFCNMLEVVGSSLKMVKFEPTLNQHVATMWPNAIVNVIVWPGFNIVAHNIGDVERNPNSGILSIKQL